MQLFKGNRDEPARKVRNQYNSTLALFPGPTDPGIYNFIPKRTGTPYSQPFFIAFLPSRSQMSKIRANIFLNIFWKQGPGSSPRRLSKKSCPSRPPEPSQRVRLEKLACLKFIWLGDLRICPFRAPKPFFSRQNGEIQVADFSGF